MCTSWKRFCCCHCLFAFILTIIYIIILVLGIFLIVVSTTAVDAIDEACGGKSDSEIAKNMNELYTRSDTFYCMAAPTGCPCAVTHVPKDTLTRTYVVPNTVGSVTNVQACKDKLQAAYASYGVSFDDINDIIKYLDYFGDIEEEYKCSGICIQQAKYYFWDSTKGEPTKACKDPIKDELLIGEVQGFGIGYVVIAAVLMVVWFVQYGLCCRKQPAPGHGGTKNF